METAGNFIFNFSRRHQPVVYSAPAIKTPDSNTGAGKTGSQIRVFECYLRVYVFVSTLIMYLRYVMEFIILVRDLCS